ncbi:MAG: DUF3592 domain-containing protein [Acidobacteria bacterium]|nr:DUF3592 domain-containing protein [Acidobacteriota bacterium]
MPGKTKNQNSKTGLFIGALIFGGLGIFLLFGWVQNLQMAHASKSWPSVQGTVVSSRVVRIQELTDKKKKRPQYSYKPLVKYSYSVEGQGYLSSRISFGDYYTNKRDHARHIVAAYPAGKTVRVYYDPEAPMHSVLERKAGLGNKLHLLLGFLFVLGGFLLLYGFFVKLFRGE